MGNSTLQALGEDSHGLYAWDANDATAVLVDSSVKAKHGGGKVEGYNGGVYATWFQNADTQLGAYVDLWTQYGWFNNRVEGEGLL